MKPQQYRNALDDANTNPEYLKRHAVIKDKCLPGIDIYQFIVFDEDRSSQFPTDQRIQFLVARQIDTYFPDISPNEIRIDEVVPSNYCWASVGKLNFKTRWRTSLENLDMYAPIVMNLFGLLLLILKSCA
jgi:hypothetical protein